MVVSWLPASQGQPESKQAHKCEGRTKVMFEELRGELKVIIEWWSRQNIENSKEAVVIREMRRREITRQLTEIAAMK